MGDVPNPFAFPSGDFQGYEPGSGMTLRDYFAGQALAGLATTYEPGVRYSEDIAEIAFRCADAMIEARKLP